MGNLHDRVARIMAAGGAGAHARFLAEDIAELPLALVPCRQKNPQVSKMRTSGEFRPDVEHPPHCEPKMMVAMFEKAKNGKEAVQFAVRSVSGENFVAKF